MSFSLIVNGQNRSFERVPQSFSLAQAVAEMNLKGDRIAVELNGAIVQRDHWSETLLGSGDRLEVVHFVGGGSGSRQGISNPAN